jgi:hypothetical protein
MGIAEIQAAFAASAATATQPAAAQTNPFGAPAPAPFAAPLTPAAPSPAFPAPVFNQPPSNPFAPAAAPVVLQGHIGQLQPAAFQVGPGVAPANAPAPFAFTPPAGFAPASAPPINPVGERQSLNTAAPVAPFSGGLTTEQAAAAIVAAHAPIAPEPAPKGRRTRKSKFTDADKALAAAAGAEAPLEPVQGLTLDELGQVHAAGQAALAEDEPARGSAWTTEELCDFLTARGYTVKLER